MPTLRTRASKASELTHNELDANFTRPITQKTTTYSILVSDNRSVIEGNHASTPFTITLPTVAAAAAAETGDFEVTVTNINDAVVTLDGNGSETIDDKASLTIARHGAVTVKLNAGGTAWSVVSRKTSGSDFSFIHGLTTSNGTDTDHDIDIATGKCTDSGNNFIISLTSGITKAIDADWAEGTGNGGLATGARTTTNIPNPSTTYHFFVIAKTNGTVDAGWDTSLTAANLLTDASAYTYYQRIASHAVDGSSNLPLYNQINNEFLLTTVIQSVNDTSPGTSANLYDVGVPTGIQVGAIVGIDMAYGNTNGAGLITSPDQTDSAPGNSLLTVRVNANSTLAHAVLTVRTDTSGQIRYRQSDANPDVQIFTYGWVDERIAG